jgi:hypothetical protein
VQANPGGAVVDQMTALFLMANRCLIRAPAALLSSGAIHPLLGGALQVCGWREMDPLRAALTFITSFVGDLDDIGDDWAAQHLLVIPSLDLRALLCRPCALCIPLLSQGSKC